MTRVAAAQSRPPPRAVWALAVLLLATWAVACMPCHAAPSPDSDQLERAVKAAFLYKFQLYVVWPNRAFASATSPFNVCIVSGPPFGDLIDRVVQGQRYGEHPLVVVRAGSAVPDVQCHIMYIATQDTQITQQALAAAVGQPELTVTDGAEDGAPKGIINFRIVDDRVRFDIDNAAAVRGGLSISSKLLGVALSVTPGP